MNAAAVLLVGLLALLAGCDQLKKIPLTPADALRAGERFGAASRVQTERTSEGTVYRLMIESKRPASWLQADRAMWSDLRHTCPDGERYRELSSDPVADRETLETLSREHPAGTLFVRTVRCEPKPDYEFEFETVLSPDQANDLMYARLRAIPLTATARPTVVPLTASRHSPKYEQLERALGIWVGGQVRTCPEGVVLRGVSLGTQPPSPERPDDQPEAYLAFVVDCIGAEPLHPATLPKEAPSPHALPRT